MAIDINTTRMRHNRLGVTPETTRALRRTRRGMNTAEGSLGRFCTMKERALSSSGHQIKGCE